MFKIKTEEAAKLILEALILEGLPEEPAKKRKSDLEESFLGLAIQALDTPEESNLQRYRQGLFNKIYEENTKELTARELYLMCASKHQSIRNKATEYFNSPESTIPRLSNTSSQCGEHMMLKAIEYKDVPLAQALCASGFDFLKTGIRTNPQEYKITGKRYTKRKTLSANAACSSENPEIRGLVKKAIADAGEITADFLKSFIPAIQVETPEKLGIIQQIVEKYIALSKEKNKPWNPGFIKKLLQTPLKQHVLVNLLKQECFIEGAKQYYQSDNIIENEKRISHALKACLGHTELFCSLIEKEVIDLRAADENLLRLMCEKYTKEKDPCRKAAQLRSIQWLVENKTADINHMLYHKFHRKTLVEIFKEKAPALCKILEKAFSKTSTEPRPTDSRQALLTLPALNAPLPPAAGSAAEPAGGGGAAGFPTPPSMR